MPAIKEARAKITPWLWVFSLVGFTLTTMNSRRIGKMFGEWKKGVKLPKGLKKFA
jgi:hypothetical protein